MIFGPRDWASCTWRRQVNDKRVSPIRLFPALRVDESDLIWLVTKTLRSFIQSSLTELISRGKICWLQSLERYGRQIALLESGRQSLPETFSWAKTPPKPQPRGVVADRKRDVAPPTLRANISPGQSIVNAGRCRNHDLTDCSMAVGSAWRSVGASRAR
jgi:hypothetical protein